MTRLQIVGDDLLVTNPERVRRGIKENAANALLVKVNQIGSLTETIEAVESVTAQDGAQSHPTAQVKPKTRPLRIWLLHSIQDRSRLAHLPAQTVWRNTINSCASKRSWVIRKICRLGRTKEITNAKLSGTMSPLVFFLGREHVEQ